MVQKRRSGRGGFTLIEMMAVIAILAILASVTIPSFLKYIGKVEEGTYRSEAETMYVAVRIYIVEENANETLNRDKMKTDLMEYPLGDSQNVLTEAYRGGYTEGARIEVLYLSDSGVLMGMTYDVDGYRIVISQGEETTVTKL